MNHKYKEDYINMSTEDSSNVALTGVRAVAILAMLIESPKSLDEIIEKLVSFKHLKFSASKDTVRNDLNVLRKVGCNISNLYRARHKKYTVLSHFLEYSLDKETIDVLYTTYKSVMHYLKIEDIIKIEKLLIKLAAYTNSSYISEILRGLSITRSLNTELLTALYDLCKDKRRIIFLYNSHKSGISDFEIICDKLMLRNQKLYICGYCQEHKSYSFFLVKNIKKIIDVKEGNIGFQFPTTNLIYELKNPNEINFKPRFFETIIKETPEKIVVKVEHENDFILQQRILELGRRCTVISPEWFRDNIIETLNKMKDLYDER